MIENAFVAINRKNRNILDKVDTFIVAAHRPTTNNFKPQNERRITSSPYQDHEKSSKLVHDPFRLTMSRVVKAFLLFNTCSNMYLHFTALLELFSTRNEMKNAFSLTYA